MFIGLHLNKLNPDGLNLLCNHDTKVMCSKYQYTVVSMHFITGVINSGPGEPTSSKVLTQEQENEVMSFEEK